MLIFSHPRAPRSSSMAHASTEMESSPLNPLLRGISLIFSSKFVQFFQVMFQGLKSCAETKRDDDIPPANDRELANPPKQPTDPLVSKENSMSKVGQYLRSNRCVFKYRMCSFEKNMRCIPLYAEAMFDSLVTLYAPLLLTHWPMLKPFMNHFTAPRGVQPWVYAAQNYISAWIHDLYVSNRDAVKKASSSAFPHRFQHHQEVYYQIAFQRHYQHEEVYYSHQYDDFLVKLNASIRPTNIIGMPTEATFLPLLAEEPAWDTPNPFHIQNYTVDSALVSGLIGILKGRRVWNVSTITTEPIGRPVWLFDWHSNTGCCAWFPDRENYNMEDLSLTCILGVACTPNLGPRDVDDWQDFKHGVVPTYHYPEEYEHVVKYPFEEKHRVVPRRFFGYYEVRTIKQRNASPSPRASTAASAGMRTKGKAGNEVEAIPEIHGATPQFQRTDWVYYYLIDLKIDPHARSEALKMIVEC